LTGTEKIKNAEKNASQTAHKTQTTNCSTLYIQNTKGYTMVLTPLTTFGHETIGRHDAVK